MDLLKPCPFLPEVENELDFRILQRHGRRRDEAFYLDALRYGQFLWRQRHAGRALLALTRALYAEVAVGDPVLQVWPLPYAAFGWILENHDRDDFPGNPRISFQHQASRLRGPREDQRSVRAWAVWGLVRVSRPGLAGDRSQPVTEPDFDAVVDGLTRHGHPREATLWSEVVGNRRW